jgi:hypothetical protein
MKASAKRFAAVSKNFTTPEGEEGGLKRDALHNLADALAEDMVDAPRQMLVSEAAEDFGDARALAVEFDDAFGRVTRASHHAAASDPATPLRGSRRILSWSAVSSALSTVLELATLPRSRILLGAVAVLLVAILTPGLYRSLVEGPIPPSTTTAPSSAPNTSPPIARVSPLPSPSDSSGMVLRGPGQPRIDQSAVERIRAAQRELARVGCFSGPPEGNFTDATKDAVKDYWMSTGRREGEIAITEALIADIRRHEGRICVPDDSKH